MTEFRYDTQLLIEGEGLDEDAINEYIRANFKGDCLLAVGDDELIKLHYHTNEPWKVLEYCASLGEAFDRKGLIYGMGHAVYSISDPRERVLKSYVQKLAEAKGKTTDMALYSNIEEIAPQLIAEKRRIYKGVSPNVDFYSGFVYDMLGIPVELYTPLFAIARVVGWSAHRIEELVGMGKIIRPAYKSVMEEIK